MFLLHYLPPPLLLHHLHPIHPLDLMIFLFLFIVIAIINVILIIIKIRHQILWNSLNSKFSCCYLSSYSDYASLLVRVNFITIAAIDDDHLNCCFN